jgi:hypothetical protein
MFCRTRVGSLRLYWEGREYLLDPNGAELPDDLAENIRPHVNVVVEAPVPAPEPPRKKSAPAAT